MLVVVVFFCCCFAFLDVVVVVWALLASWQSNLVLCYEEAGSGF